MSEHRYDSKFYHDDFPNHRDDAKILNDDFSEHREYAAKTRDDAGSLAELVWQFNANALA